MQLYGSRSEKLEGTPIVGMGMTTVSRAIRYSNSSLVKLGHRHLLAYDQIKYHTSISNDSSSDSDPLPATSALLGL